MITKEELENIDDLFEKEEFTQKELRKKGWNAGKEVGYGKVFFREHYSILFGKQKQEDMYSPQVYFAGGGNVYKWKNIQDKIEKYQNE